MTPEITALDVQINALKAARNVLEQEHLASVAAFPVGSLINWDRCNTGRVIGFDLWAGSCVSYRVRRLKANGIDGAVVTVDLYQKPRAA